MTLDEFFAGFGESRQLYEAVRAALHDTGDTEERVTKSQIAFVHGRAFAWVWMADRYLSGGHAPLVLSVSLPRRDGSSRWKQVTEPAEGRFMHHLELWDETEVDAQVRAWLREAWESAAR